MIRNHDSGNYRIKFELNCFAPPPQTFWSAQFAKQFLTFAYTKI